MKSIILIMFLLLNFSISLSSCATQVELIENNGQVVIDDPDKIKQAQGILSKTIYRNKIPYYVGNMDGKINDETTKALIYFQEDHQIVPANGELNKKTYEQLIQIKELITINKLPKNVANLSNNELYELTAYLKDLGYYVGNISDAIQRRSEIEKNLLEFQKSFGIFSNLVTDETWDRLKKIKLSEKINAELRNIVGPSSQQTANSTAVVIPTTPPTQADKIVQPTTTIKNDQHTKPISQPKKQPASPTLPTFQLAIEQNVFAVEEVKCKDKNAAWITFYEGKIHSIQNDQVEIQLAKRYALWYDNRKQGVSHGDWWCIPRQRFCYAEVNFSDWGGAQKIGINYTFDKDKVIPTDTTLGRDDGIAALSAKLADKQCDFKKKIKSSLREILATRISQHHYTQPDFLQVEKQLNTIEMYYDQFNHYLSKLDPYSKYLTLEQNDFFKKRQALKQVSIGVNILFDGNNILVVPLYDKPAYQAGLTQVQYLKTLNEQEIDLDDFDSYRFLAELLPEDTVQIEVSSHLNQSNTKTYQVKPTKMDNPSIQYIAEEYPIIRIYRFDDREKTQEKLKQYVQKSIEAKKPIIIDLRYCPGGSFYSAVDATTWFLESKLPVAYLKTAKPSDLVSFESSAGKIVEHQKIYLWTSPYTASAAEVFVRALQTHAKNSVVIGRKTEGKCLSQQDFEFEDGSALRLSVYEILTPDKQSCEGKGIDPDKIIKLDDILNDEYYLQYSMH